MLVSTPDHDEWVERYKTFQWTAKPSKNGDITVFHDGTHSTSLSHVYPHLVLRRSIDSPIPAHPFKWFKWIMQTRAAKKRIALVLACPDRDVCRRVHEFLEPDEHVQLHKSTRTICLIGPSTFSKQSRCLRCNEVTKGWATCCF